jgi:HD-like signal output (HDOD) protein
LLTQAAQLPASQQDLLFVSTLLSALGPLSKLQLAAQSLVQVPDQINGISSDVVFTVYLLTIWGYPEALCQLELGMSIQDQNSDPTDLHTFILFVTQQYYQPCSSAFLQKMANLVEHEGLQQALLKLPALPKP